MAAYTTLFFLLLIGAFAALVIAVDGNCDCGKGICCNKWGFCGTSSHHCGSGCQSGPCGNLPATKSTVSYSVTDDLLDWINDNWPHLKCQGKRFYSRASFLEAVRSYPMFGNWGSNDDSRREIAAFFAHATFFTDFFCTLKGGRADTYKYGDYCDENNTQYPCVAGKAYYGRGPMSLSWNYNYGRAGESIGFDGLNEPEKVATDLAISFKTALWYWMENVHSILTSGSGHAFECNYKGKITLESPRASRTRTLHNVSIFGLSALRGASIFVDRYLWEEPLADGPDR